MKKLPFLRYSYFSLYYEFSRSVFLCWESCENDDVETRELIETRFLWAVWLGSWSCGRCSWWGMSRGRVQRVSQHSVRRWKWYLLIQKIRDIHRFRLSRCTSTNSSQLSYVVSKSEILSKQKSKTCHLYKLDPAAKSVRSPVVYEFTSNTMRPEKTNAYKEVSDESEIFSMY